MYNMLRGWKSGSRLCQAFAKKTINIHRPTIHTSSVCCHGKNTIDDEEVAKFSRIASSWWNTNGEFGALHSLNELRVPLVRESLLSRRRKSKDEVFKKRAKPLRNFKILDVGCGGGLLSEAMARLGADVTGVDASEENIQVARLHADRDYEISGNLTYKCCAVEDLPQDEKETFDGVIASEIVEHVNNQDLFMASCCDLVKPNGSLFVTTMNKTKLSLALGVIAAEKVLRIVPDGAHDWNKFISPDELGDIIRKYGFSVKLVHGMTLNPMTLKWKWISRTDINYALHAVKTDVATSYKPPLTDTDSDSDSSDSDSDSGIDRKDR